MSKDSSSLLDIFLAGQKVLNFAEGLTRAELETDALRQSAILYQIEVMGEAAKRISPKFREKHHQIPWRELAGMRDVIIHQYDQIDFDQVWFAIKKSIPELIEMISPLLPKK